MDPLHNNESVDPATTFDTTAVIRTGADDMEVVEDSLMMTIDTTTTTNHHDSDTKRH